jgi:hypothetical protein
MKKKNYLLKNVDPALWRRVKARAAAEGKTIRSLLLHWLRKYGGAGK